MVLLSMLYPFHHDLVHGFAVIFCINLYLVLAGAGHVNEYFITDHLLSSIGRAISPDASLKSFVPIFSLRFKFRMSTAS